MFMAEIWFLPLFFMEVASSSSGRLNAVDDDVKIGKCATIHHSTMYVDRN